MLGIVQTVLVDIVIERSAAIYIEEHTHVCTIGAESVSESGKTQFWIEIYLLFLEEKAKVTLSPSSAGISQSKTTDEGKADDDEPSETTINDDNNMGQDNTDNAEVSSVADKHC